MHALCVFVLVASAAACANSVRRLLMLPEKMLPLRRLPLALLFTLIKCVAARNEAQWNLYGRYGVHIPDVFEYLNQTAAVAVLDSGFEAAGWDFVSDTSISGDGDGRDSNATDPGGSSEECPVASWHGTKVASILSGSSGLDGVSPGSPLSSIRVLGLCDMGYASDVADAVVWASGGRIDGLPFIDVPAKVISMSFAGRGPCPSYLQSAVTQAVGSGAIVVAAAGNSADDVRKYFPANCVGVLSVGASTEEGTLASYSNWGAAILAPGGPLLAATVGGAVVSVTGTSFAAPHVSGVAARLLPIKGSAENATEALLRGAQALAEECTAAVCSAGVADWEGALSFGNPSISSASEWPSANRTLNASSYIPTSCNDMHYDGSRNASNYTETSCDDMHYNGSTVRAASSCSAGQYFPRQGSAVKKNTPIDYGSKYITICPDYYHVCRVDAYFSDYWIRWLYGISFHCCDSSNAVLNNGGVPTVFWLVISEKDGWPGASNTYSRFFEQSSITYFISSNVADNPPVGSAGVWICSDFSGWLCGYGSSSGGFYGSATTCDNGMVAVGFYGGWGSAMDFIALYCNYMSCQTCPAGTYSGSGADQCTSCPAGKYSGAGSGACTSCPAGKYSGAAARECTLCGMGTFSAAEGAARCTACPVNQNCGIGCTQCYNISPAFDQPPTCPAGFYGDPEVGLCSSCPGGQYMQSSTTQWAPYMFYQVISDGNTTYTATTNKLNGQAIYSTDFLYEAEPLKSFIFYLIYCGTGPGWVRSQFISCSGQGFSTMYSTNQLSASTAATGPRMLRNVAWSRPCAPCPAGTYSLAASSACISCSVGYISSAGASACTPCQYGTTNTNTGSTVCSTICTKTPPCATGYYIHQPTPSSCSSLECAMCANAVVGEYYSGPAPNGSNVCPKSACSACGLGLYSQCLSGGTVLQRAPISNQPCAVCTNAGPGYYYTGSAVMGSMSCNVTRCSACAAGKYTLSGCTGKLSTAGFCNTTCPGSVGNGYFTIATPSAITDVQAQEQACMSIGCNQGYYASGGFCTPCTRYSNCSLLSKTYPTFCNTVTGQEGGCLTCLYNNGMSAAPTYAYASSNSGNAINPSMACSWLCNAGYWADTSTVLNGVCVKCSSPTSCAAGAYPWAPCLTQSGITQQPECRACDPITNSIWTTRGTNAVSCGFVCNTGFFASGRQCVAWSTLATCLPWSTFVEGTTTTDSMCKLCAVTTSPSNLYGTAVTACAPQGGYSSSGDCQTAVRNLGTNTINYRFPFNNCTIACDAGTYLQSQQQLCAQCPFGTYSAKVGAVGNCTACATGYYTPYDAGATACVPWVNNQVGVKSEIPYIICAGGYKGVYSGDITGREPPYMCVACNNNPANFTYLAPDPTSQCNSPTFTCAATYYANFTAYQCVSCGKLPANATGWVATNTSNLSSNAQRAASCIVACINGLTPVNEVCVQSQLVCAPGKYVIVAPTTCTTCAAGSYCVNSAQVPCPNLTYSLAGASSCTPCDYALVNATTKQVKCGLCDSNMYYLSSASSCVPMMGYYLNSSLKSVPCARNCTNTTTVHCNSAGNTVCCGKGYAFYDGMSSSTSCTACAPGTHSVNGAACVACAPGSFAQASNASVCDTCAAGYFSATNASACMACLAGMYSASPNSSSCVNCPEGGYSNATAATRCELCPPGYNQPLSGKTFCYQCMGGHYSTIYGSIFCSACEAGTYATAFAQTSCTVCPQGSYAYPPTYIQCYACAAGEYAVQPGMEFCEKCPAGTRSLPGSSACVACDYVTTDLTTGSTSCAFCPDNMYKPSWASACVPLFGYYWGTYPLPLTMIPPVSQFTESFTTHIAPNAIYANASSVYYSQELSNTFQYVASSVSSSFYPLCAFFGYYNLIGQYFYKPPSNSNEYLVSPSIFQYAYWKADSSTPLPNTLVDGTFFQGDWWQIQMLEGISVQSFSLPLKAFVGACGNVMVAGSNDGDSWSSIQYQESISADTASQTPGTYVFLGYPPKYKYIRFITLKAYSEYVGLLKNRIDATISYLPSDAFRLNAYQLQRCPITYWSCRTDLIAHCTSAGQIVCCGPGTTFLDGMSAASSCQQCDVGTYSPFGVSCLPCDAGFFSSSTGSSSCNKCAAGTYSNAGSTSCTSTLICPPGSVSINGSRSCVACNPGWYSSTDSSVCILACPAGTFGAASMSCTLCPNGSTSAAGSSKCTVINGYYDLGMSLLAYYPFDAANVTADASGNLRTLIPSLTPPTVQAAGPWNGGTCCSSAYFSQNASSSGLNSDTTYGHFFSIPPIPRGESGQTMCAWLRPTGSVAKSGDVVVAMGVHFPSKLPYSMWIPGSSALWVRNVWTHVCTSVSSNGKMWTTYVNGRLVSNGSYVNTNPNLVYNMNAIARGFVPTNQLFVGAIDEVRIYSRNLSGAEIAAVYAYAGNATTSVMPVACAPGTSTSADGSYCVCNYPLVPLDGVGFPCGCSPGTYITSGVVCTPCPVNTSNANKDTVGVSSCSQCPKGKYTTDAGSTSCTCTPPLITRWNNACACPPGNFQNATDMTCISCPPGTFMNYDSILTSCRTCVPGYYCSTLGSKLAFGSGKIEGACPVGTYSTYGASQCTACASGLNTPAGRSSCENTYPLWGVGYGSPDSRYMLFKGNKIITSNILSYWGQDILAASVDISPNGIYMIAAYPLENKVKLHLLPSVTIYGNYEYETLRFGMKDYVTIGISQTDDPYMGATFFSPSCVAIYPQDTFYLVCNIENDAPFNSPSCVAIDPTGTYALVCDLGNNLVRMLNLTSYTVTTVASITAPSVIAFHPSQPYALVVGNGPQPTVYTLSLAAPFTWENTSLAGIASLSDITFLQDADMLMVTDRNSASLLVYNFSNKSLLYSISYKNRSPSISYGDTYGARTWGAKSVMFWDAKYKYFVKLNWKTKIFSEISSESSSYAFRHFVPWRCTLRGYGADANDDNCVTCASGSYGPGSGTCLICPVGTFTNASGMSVCKKCDAGTYSGISNATKCSTCPVGTFSSLAASTACARCPVGSNASAGSSRCALTAGYYDLGMSLAAYYTFDMDNVLADSAPVPLGALVASPTVPVRVPGAWSGGMAASLSQNFLKLPTFTIPSTNFAICAWIQPAQSSASGNEAVIYFSKDETGDSIRVSHGYEYQFIAMLSASSLPIGILYSFQYAPYVWMHFCLTSSDTSSSLYVNGAPGSQTLAASFAQNVTLSANYLGKSSSGANAWEGVIDDVRLYLRDLTASEVAAVYAFNSSSPTTVIPLPCPAGAPITADGSKCVVCSAGWYLPANTTVCLLCAAGTFSNAGASACTACASSVATFFCASCSASRTYAPSAGATACLRCPAYSLASLDGKACLCAPGMSWQASLAACVPCASDSIAPGWGAVGNCTRCYWGTFL